MTIPIPEPAASTPVTDVQPKPTPPATPAREFNYPTETPLSDMNAEERAEYWREKAQHHEKAWRGKAGDITPEKVKELRDKAKRLDDLEEANKTELEKANARAEVAEKALADIAAAKDASKLRDEIAKEKGVVASVLRGSTRAELEAHADELATTFKIVKPKAPPADGQGNAGSGVHGDGDMSAEDIVSAALKR